MGTGGVVDGSLVALRAVSEVIAGLTAPTSAAGAGGVADRLARVRVLEELRSQVAGLQAVEAAAHAAERAAAAVQEVATVARPGVGRRRRLAEARRVVIADVAAARRISPWQTQRWLAFAEQAPIDLPATFALLTSGQLSERRAETVFTAVRPLDPVLRGEVDRKLAPELPGWGDRRVFNAAHAAVYAVDPHGAVDRHTRAASQRRVTVRPVAEGMARVSGLVTLPQAVAVQVELERAARAATALGDTRTRSQLMADAFVTRLRTRPAADRHADGSSETDRRGPGGDAPLPDPLPVPHPTPPPVAIQLLIRADSLTGLSDHPAHFPDGTPWPAPAARDWLLGRDGTRADEPALDGAAVSVRRLLTDPVGRLVTAETHSRTFTPAMRRFMRLRDGLCLTPWCDAPIRAADHDHPHTHGGRTRLTDGRSRCQWCNTTKSDRPTVTGPDVHHLDRTPADMGPPRPDPPPPHRRRRRRGTPLERRLRRHLHRELRGRPDRPSTGQRPRTRPDFIHHRC